MKLQKNIFVKLAGLPLVGIYLTTGIYFYLDEAIGKLLILHDKRDEEGKSSTLLTEMLFADTDLG